VNEVARGSGEITSNIAGVAEAAFGHNARSHRYSEGIAATGGDVRPTSQLGWPVQNQWSRARNGGGRESIRQGHGNSRICVTGCASTRRNLPEARERLSSRRGPLFDCLTVKTFSYATTRALIGVPAVTEAPEAARSEFFTTRAASGFSHSKAMNAAIRSHMIIAQNTFVQE
jgi:hypothetical protein